MFTEEFGAYKQLLNQNKLPTEYVNLFFGHLNRTLLV